MNDPLAILHDLARLKVKVSCKGSALHIDAPEGAFTPEMKDRVLSAKPALLALLSRKQSEQFAITDIAASAGLPVYSSSDKPLHEGASRRDAGLNALILSFSARRRVAEWIESAHDQPLSPDIVQDVRADLRSALAMIELKIGKVQS